MEMHGETKTRSMNYDASKKSYLIFSHVFQEKPPSERAPRPPRARRVPAVVPAMSPGRSPGGGILRAVYEMGGRPGRALDAAHW